jgi:hypothetical protein
MSETAPGAKAFRRETRLGGLTPIFRRVGRKMRDQPKSQQSCAGMNGSLIRREQIPLVNAAGYAIFRLP